MKKTVLMVIIMVVSLVILVACSTTTEEDQVELMHTYFDDGATWSANGSYYDGEGNEIGCTGEVTITHGEQAWTLDGYMQIDDGNDSKFYNTYTITPFGESYVTSWESDNPALGKFLGDFAIIDDSIISVAVTEDGQFSSYEFLTILDENTYINRGFSKMGDVVLSSWAVTLTKVED